MASYEQKNYDDAKAERKQYVRQLLKIVLLGFFYFLGFHGLATFIAFIWIVKVARRARKNARLARENDAEQHSNFLMNMS